MLVDMSTMWLRVPRERIGRRLLSLYAGLALYGASIALMVRSELGLAPWDVLHQGIATQTGLSLGTVVIAVSVVVLALWVPLRERPGIGTISNAVLVGLAVDATLTVLPDPSVLGARTALLVAGIVLNGVATGLYIGAGLGPGPRDGLMTGVARRGISIGRARLGIELTVLAGGWALGGTVGIGTVAYAVGIGPLAQLFIPLLSVTDNRTADTEAQGAPSASGTVKGATAPAQQSTGEAAGSHTL